MSIIVT